MLEVYRSSSIEWKPSPVVALATSVDDSQVAAAREDGSLEVWLVSPGSVGWHCQLTIHGDTNSRVSSLVWCRSGSAGLPSGRLFSSSIDGSVSEWDLFGLKQKTVLESIGVSIWQIAVAPLKSFPPHTKNEPQHANGHTDDKFDGDDRETSDSEDDLDLDKLREQPIVNMHLALACDDGCVRVYSVSDSEMLTYVKSLTRVSGRVLSVTWSPDANKIFSGSSDGFIRCWDAKLGHEVYRITVGLGGSGSGPELCIWSLLVLRCGTLVSADSTGSVQFWDSQHGTLLQAHSCHKGDVNALAAAPSHNRVFSAGSDGQVILYKLSTETVASGDDKSSAEVLKKWVYVGYVRAHSHDVRALAVAVPISREDVLLDERVKRVRGSRKPIDFSYHKWAHLGVPMLISAGDDTKLCAYPANEFTKFLPYDISPAPQRMSIQLVLNSGFSQTPLLLVQASSWLDILCVRVKPGGLATTDLVARVKSKASQKIICSTISTSGSHFAFSDHMKPSLFELKRCEGGKSAWAVSKRQLPSKLPFVHSMVFSFDSSRLILAGHDRRIYVVDVGRSELVHTFTPCRKEHEEKFPPSEPPITRMFTSSDGQWLAAINCFGDIYIFNLETQRQHWFISRLDGASVAAGGFTPRNSNVLIICTSSNQVYAFDVEAKQLGEWSMRNTFVLPKRFQEFPGEVIGLSFPPSPNSSTVMVYSARATCLIDFGMPVDRDDDDSDLVNSHESALKKLQKSPINGRLKRKLKHTFLSSPSPIHTNPISYFFGSPRFSSRRIFLPNSPYGTENMSPTSILDTKPFSAITNPFGYDQNLAKLPTTTTFPGNKQFSGKLLDPKPIGIGLALIDSLIDEKTDDDNTSNSRKVLFGSKLKIQIPTLPQSPLCVSNSPKSPADFGIKTRNSNKCSSPFQFGSGNSAIQTGTNVFLSVSEMELSEDYTCVVTHGPNPRTTHIYDDSIVESCFGGVGSYELKIGSCSLPSKPNFPSKNFLSFCYTCNKKLGEGDDIFMYRGDKAFCSPECRFQEMIFDNENNSDFGGCF